MTFSPSLTGPQVAALRQMAGLNDLRRRPRPGTLNALSYKGLRNPDGSITGLGRVVARMEGWIPTDRQQDLICSLADGDVERSNKYHLDGERPRGPAEVLDRMVSAGVAIARIERGACLYRATNLGHELALHLRQQTLPPPCRAGTGG